MANENFNSFDRGTVIGDQATYDAGLRAHMIRVYNFMASGLASWRSACSPRLS